MSNRNTLHKSKLVDFKNWLIKNGWILEDCKGDYEVVRARKNNKLLLIYDNHRSAHLQL